MVQPTFRLTLCLTHRCDLACPYCYAGRASSRDMAIETAREAVRLSLSRLPAGGLLQLGLFGGEPLLAWETIDRLLEEVPRQTRARGMELIVSLTTNGTRLSRARFDRLNDAGVQVAVSLDGTPEVHDAQRPDHRGRGSHARVARRLRALGADAGRLSAVMVVTPASAGALAHGVAAILELGIERIELNLDYHADWPAAARERLRESCHQMASDYCRRARGGRPFSLSWIDTPLSAVLVGGYPEPIRCGYGDREIAVAPSGRVYPCERLVGEDREHGRALGTLAQLAEPLAARAERCEAGDYCISWCPCNNVVRTGRPDRADDLIHFICRLQLELAAAVVRELELQPMGGADGRG